MKNLCISIALVIMILACGDSSTGPTMTPTPTPAPIPTPAPQPTEARVTVILGELNLTVESINPPQARAQWPITIKESAGVAVTVNFVRLEARWTGRPDHRAEVGADKIVAQYGTNRVPGKGILIMIPGPVFIVPLQANLTGLRITIGMRDAFGNDQTRIGSSGSMSIRQYNALARFVQ